MAWYDYPPYHFLNFILSSPNGSGRQLELPPMLRCRLGRPFNLAGVILPGPRVPAVSTNFLVFRDGVVVRSVIGQKSHSGEADPGGSLPAVARSR